MGSPRPYHPLCDFAYQEPCGCATTFLPTSGHAYHRLTFCWHHEPMRELWRAGLLDRARKKLEKARSEYRT